MQELNATKDKTLQRKGTQVVSEAAADSRSVGSSGGLRGGKPASTAAAASAGRNLKEEQQAPQAEEAAVAATGARLRGTEAGPAALDEVGAAVPNDPAPITGGLRGAAKAVADAVLEAVREELEEEGQAAARLRGGGHKDTPAVIETAAAVEQPRRACTGGRVWSECARPCDATCGVPTPICAAVCVARCHCPAGRPIWDGQRCIAEADCPVPVPEYAAAAPAASSSSSSSLLRGVR